MISYLYLFLLTIFYDNVNNVTDYYIILSLINVIIILGLFYKKLNFKYIILILISSLIIDFITFNYLFSIFLISFVPIIVLNKIIKNYNISIIFKISSSLFLSFLALLLIDINFYLNISIFDIPTLLILVFITNLLLLRFNVLRL
jgi:hypothetical protein